MDASTEQRKDIRFKIPEEAIVVTPYSICQLIDVSSGGMALKCHDNNMAIPEEFSLGILVRAKNYYDEKIPVKLVWEKTVSHSYLPNVAYKRIGVEYGNITASQQAQLDYSFIKQTTMTT